MPTAMLGPFTPKLPGPLNCPPSAPAPFSSGFTLCTALREVSCSFLLWVSGTSPSSGLVPCHWSRLFQLFCWLPVYSSGANVIFQVGGKSGGQWCLGNQAKEVRPPEAGSGVDSSAQGLGIFNLAFSGITVSKGGDRAEREEAAVFRHSWGQEGPQTTSIGLYWLQ